VKIGAIALGLCLLLGGCGPSAPLYGDPFTRLVNQNSTAVPIDHRVKVEQPLGIIFSDNVELYLKYTKQGEDLLHSFGPLTNTVAAADIDPKFIAGRVLSMLKERYPDIELLHDFNEALDKGKKSVCLVDIQVVIGKSSGRTTTVDVSTFFFDSSMIPQSRLKGHGSGTIPYPAFDTQVQSSTEQALSELKGKLDTLTE
jgi:hypothetical protein